MSDTQTELQKAIEQLETCMNSWMLTDYSQNNLIVVTSAAKRTAELEQKLKEVEKERDELKASDEDGAKKLCELWDKLGARGCLDEHAAAIERIRDLVMLQDELTHLKQSLDSVERDAMVIARTFVEAMGTVEAYCGQRPCAPDAPLAQWRTVRTLAKRILEQKGGGE